jgi:hypothetical protein
MYHDECPLVSDVAVLGGSSNEVIYTLRFSSRTGSHNIRRTDFGMYITAVLKNENVNKPAGEKRPDSLVKTVSSFKFMK